MPKPYTLFGLLFILLMAQSQASEAYRCRIHFLDYMPGLTAERAQAGVPFQFESEGVVESIIARPGSTTDYFSYVGPPQLLFFRQQANASGRVERVLMLSATVGAVAEKLIVVIRDPLGVFQGRVLDIGLAPFPVGNVRIVNLSPALVLAKLGDERAQLASSGVYDFKLSGDQKRYVLRLSMAVKDEDEAYLLEDCNFALRRSGRKLLLIHPTMRSPEELVYTTLVLPTVVRVKD
jgi:hypothetical protein